METWIHHSKNFFFLLLLAVGFIGCDDENRQDMTPEIGEGEGTPSATMYTPTSGGKSTELTLYGTHFGMDLDKIRVTVNGVEAEVTGALGNIITAKVQRGSGSGIVKVYIGEGTSAKELTYKNEFEYSMSPLVSTYVGNYNPSDITKESKKEGLLTEAVLWKPGSIAFDKEGSLYIVEDDDRDIRLVKGNQVSTFLRGEQTGGLLFRFMDMAVSLDGNTTFIANDANASGNAHIATMVWNNDGHTYENLSAIWSVTPSLGNGVTNVGVHPITGEVFSISHGNAMIYKYDPVQKSMVSTGQQLPGVTEGTVGSKVKIRSILFDKPGTTVYMSSQGQHVIYKGDYNMETGLFSNLQIWIGKYGTAGFKEGSGGTTLLEEPCQMDVDEEGNVYVSVRKKHRIARISPDGVMNSYTGTGTSGATDGPLDKAQYNHPEGVRFGTDGALYISDYWNHKIRKIEKD